MLVTTRYVIFPIVSVRKIYDNELYKILDEDGAPLTWVTITEK